MSKSLIISNKTIQFAGSLYVYSTFTINVSANSKPFSRIKVFNLTAYIDAVVIFAEQLYGDHAVIEKTGTFQDSKAELIRL